MGLFREEFVSTGEFDEDYDRIAAITGQPTGWRAPKGTLALIPEQTPRAPRAGQAQGTHAVPEVAEACESMRPPAGSRFAGDAGTLALRQPSRAGTRLPW